MLILGCIERVVRQRLCLSPAQRNPWHMAFAYGRKTPPAMMVEQFVLLCGQKMRVSKNERSIDFGLALQPCDNIPDALYSTRRS